MKQFITSLLVFSLVFVSFNANAAEKPTEDSTFIYVYRVGQFGGAASNWAIFLDGEKICKLSNNKFIRVAVAPGKHKISAKIGGVDIFKKETVIEVDAETGGSYYVACNIKQSITRSRLEMVEVTKSSAAKQMEKMSVDNCQEKIDTKE
jgi:Protein of unknown function (DUF2846)